MTPLTLVRMVFGLFQLLLLFMFKSAMFSHMDSLIPKEEEEEEEKSLLNLDDGVNEDPNIMVYIYDIVKHTYVRS